MKVEITLRSTNKVINALVKVMEPSIDRISAPHSIFSFDIEDKNEWLTKERKEAFEKKYNEEMSVLDPDIYYIVEKISVSNN